MRGRVEVGSVVRVRLHGRRMRAYVTELLEAPAVPDPTSLSALVSEEPLFDASTVRLARWVAHRYLTPAGVVLHQATPGRYSAPRRDGQAPPAPTTPVPEWLADPDGLRGVVRTGSRGVVLLPHPAAEVAAVAAAASLAAAEGKRTLVIAPRIDVADRIAAAVPGAATLHSDQRPAARARAWARARDGEAHVLVGGRAALLTPVADLGLVVVASAHDRALKAERAPRLHGLVVASERARDAEAAFLACSPSPPLELCEDGGAWIEGSPHARPAIRPEVVAPRGGPVTDRLLDAVRGATRSGRDALVFIGRKGYALRVRCRECGWFPRCPACGTGLTLLGRDAPGLRCRSCAATARVPSSCEVCGGAHLDGAGWGDQRLAGALEGHDLGAPVVRVDADSPMPDDRPRPAVVVGTQAAMWSLEPGSAGAVCVADLDQLLGLPDFRAGEHAHALLWELAGVLTPGGRFILQTREREHHVVQAFTRRSYRFFADRELPQRRAAGYPPFAVLVHADLPEGAFDALRGAARAGGGEAIGPLPKGRGRAAALVRGSELEPLLEPLRGFVDDHPEARLDVDPVDVL